VLRAPVLIVPVRIVGVKVVLAIKKASFFDLRLIT